MPYALLDDQFHANPKIKKAGLDGAGVYAMALSYCGDYSTDGFVPKWWVEGITGRRRKLIQRLVEVELWHLTSPGDVLEMVDRKGNSVRVHVDEPGYFIPDFVQLNVSSVEARMRHAEKSSAGRKGAIKRWGDSNTHSDRDSSSDSTGNSRPDGKTHGSARARPHGSPTPTPSSSSKAVAGTTNAGPSANGQEPAAAIEPNDLTPLDIDTDPDVDERGFKPLDRVHRLLAELRDRDTGTENVLRRRFSNLSDGAFEFAREEVIRCRPTTRSDAALAVKILNRVLDTGLIGEPADEEALPSPNGVEPPPPPKRSPLERALQMVDTVGWDYDPVALGHELDEIGVTDPGERRQVGLRVEELRAERGVPVLAVVDIDESQETL